jgi:hypothetical protein
MGGPELFAYGNLVSGGSWCGWRRVAQHIALPDHARLLDRRHNLEIARALPALSQILCGLLIARAGLYPVLETELCRQIAPAIARTFGRVPMHPRQITHTG